MATEAVQSRATKMQLMGLALTVITLFGGGVWQFSKVSADVDSNAAIVKTLEAKVDRHETDKITLREWSQLMARLDKIDNKLDSLGAGRSAPREAPESKVRTRTSNTRVPERDIQQVVSTATAPPVLPSPVKKEETKDVVGIVKGLINKLKGN